MGNALSKLTETLAGAGTPQLAEGNRPVTLEGRENLWLVSEGSVDLFAVRLKGGEPLGARRHLARVHAGRVLFGMDSHGGEEGVTILAVGVAGTSVVPCNRSLLVQRAQQDDCGLEQLEPLLGEWVSVLSEGIAGKLQHKGKHRELSGGLPEEGKKGEILRSSGKTIWIRLEKGALLFMGSPLLPSIPANVISPCQDLRGSSGPTTAHSRSARQESLFGRAFCGRPWTIFTTTSFPASGRRRTGSEMQTGSR